MSAAREPILSRCELRVKSHRTIDPHALKTPRPAGAESTLTENVASPFHAEPRHNGISTLFICEGLLCNGHGNARHTALDPCQSSGFKNCGLQLLEEAGIANLVEYYPEESQIALPRFVSEGREFDFAFVDGSHLFDRVFLDLIYLGRLVRPGRIIFADDYQAPAVAHAVSFCLTNLGWKLEETAPPSTLHQWVVLRTAREPLRRSYPHFMNF